MTVEHLPASNCMRSGMGPYFPQIADLSGAGKYARTIYALSQDQPVL